MKIKWVSTAIVVLAVYWAFMATPHAQTPAQTLTLLYSNNINGEIDPCPT